MVGIFSNDYDYNCWCHTTSAQSQFYYIMIKICGLVDDPKLLTAGKQYELEKSQIAKSKTAIQRIIMAIRNITNPFEVIEKVHLFNLESGAPTPKDVERDALRGEKIRKEKSFCTKLF